MSRATLRQAGAVNDASEDRASSIYIAHRNHTFDARLRVEPEGILQGHVSSGHGAEQVLCDVGFRVGRHGFLFLSEVEQGLTQTLLCLGEPPHSAEDSMTLAHERDRDRNDLRHKHAVAHQLHIGNNVNNSFNEHDDLQIKLGTTIPIGK